MTTKAAALAPWGTKTADTLRFALAAGGVAWFLLQVVAFRNNWWIPGGDIRDVFLASGHAIRDGISPYYLPGNPTPFFYSPPWAVAFAALSFLPVPVAYVVVVSLEVAALRYMAGTWRRFCYFLWFPLLPFEILGGAINLIVAASIVAAVRGHAWLAVAGGLAKLSPMLAGNPRQWRRYVLPLGVAFAVTLPWLWLWPAWIDALWIALTGPPLGPLAPVPLAVRLPVALVLVASRRPWAVAAGAAIATPAFYFVSIVLLIAPLAVWLNRESAPVRSDPAH